MVNNRMINVEEECHGVTFNDLTVHHEFGTSIIDKYCRSRVYRGYNAGTKKVTLQWVDKSDDGTDLKMTDFVSEGSFNELDFYLSPEEYVSDDLEEIMKVLKTVRIYVIATHLAIGFVFFMAVTKKHIEAKLTPVVEQVQDK